MLGALQGTADIYSLAGTVSFGAGRFLHPDLTGGTLSGNFFYAETNGPGSYSVLSLDPGYTTGNPISGSIIFAGQTVSGAFGTNLAAPKVMFDDGVNQVIYTAASPAPAPPVPWLLVTGLALLMWRRRRGRSDRAARLSLPQPEGQHAVPARP